MSSCSFYLNTPAKQMPFIEGGASYYDGSSEGSSIGSPMNHGSVEDIALNGNNGHLGSPAYSYGYQTPVPPQGPSGAIPIQFEVASLYEDLDRRRSQNARDNSASAQVNFRRRAQNRASQRAFRDRKEKHVKKVEERLQELEAKYSDLSQSYDALQIEYTAVKKELEKLMGEEEKLDGASPNENDCNISLSGNAYETPRGGLLEYSTFDESAFCFEQESIGENRDFGGLILIQE